MRQRRPIRSADPWRDGDVIDARAPRINQAVVGTISLIAFLTGWWPLLTVVAAQLAIGLRFGRRYCLPCLLYFNVLQPRFGEGEIEDSRPPRFANQVGVVFLGTASVAHALGLTTIGWILGLAVAALAILASTTGFCVGCELYKLSARLRSIRPGALTRIDLTELAVVAAGNVVVQFTHPLCTDCGRLERTLHAEGRQVVTVDVSRRPELARKYGVAVVPTAVDVAPDGRVTARIA